jgi:hypothetical protein
MYFYIVESDQSDTWSDETPKPTHCGTAETPQRSPAPIAPAPIDPARFSHRALQTMRQAGMQMRRHPRPWPQVLSVGQLPGLATADGLRATGILRANRGVAGQLPSSPRDPRGHLRDQPRTAASSRGAVKVGHAQSALFPPHTDRCGIGRRTPRQYARSLARRQSKEFAYGRGNR